MSRTIFACLAASMAALALAACGGAATTSETDVQEPPPEAAVNVEVPTAMAAADDAAEESADAAMEEAADDAADASAEGDAGAGEAMTMTAKLDLNSATEEELETVPGAGERMVHEFLEYRPYDSIEQFRREIGKYVDEATVLGYEAYLYVPVDPNAADEATLMQLPGVDAAAAAELTAGRPYADREAFLAALGALVTAEELAAGGAYVAAP